ncbi:hypothetical protein [Paremcibacter congregatus]|uniref:hypothetical protein n=1 Tax=Paremcibacter congregatus TaxID=2043170 RepID=UPI0030EC22EC|tara:strand:- start:4244 stop:5464 length:1221 start_codon:yes stop_codon:yes gene_type:complete
MTIKWKKKNFNPDIVLGKIDTLKEFDSNGEIFFSKMGYRDSFITLQGMVEFLGSAKDLNKGLIISEAVRNVAQTGILTSVNVLAEMKTIAAERLKTCDNKFFFLTSLSVHHSFPIRVVNIENCRIRLLNGAFPKKFASRDTLIERNYDIKDETPEYYSQIIVSLKCRSVNEAISKAFKVIDITRSIWCLFNNPTCAYTAIEWTPINSIRLGKIHTIHHENGTSADDDFWYEPNFVKKNLCNPKDVKIFRKNYKWALNKINKSPYGNVIKESLVRYVRALDERDPNVALIKLWGALEELASPGQANYDLITRRVSSLFVESGYHKQILEQLREYRNRNVHSGEETALAKLYCFQLQSYYSTLLFFHVRNAGEFIGLDEANSFLDLPRDKKALMRKVKLLEKAVKFIS